VEYRLDPDNGWSIDLADVAAKMDESVRLLVIINPNNPTGGIADRQTLEGIIDIASRWPLCTILSDEIYDGLAFETPHQGLAALSTEVPVITLNGVSKVFYAPGWRIGYMAWHDPLGRLAAVRDGVERLLRCRLCASTPAQYGYLAGLEGPREWMLEYQQKLLAQRDYAVQRIEAIDGIETEIPGGAFYMFPRLTHPRWATADKQFVLDFLHQEHVLLVHGSGFSTEYGTGHFRMVYLPEIEILSTAFDRLERFLATS
jgi:aspartate/methionine/tyrosine aminotransferase